ncbi:MAG: prepilin-type N-terminal cleavage/methylation domain-containing protein [Bdellovibrionota bacterium]|nr:prepilin-type N-terminal cleavage/methylation domain-containing protein [Bdellovibrionota bacterium]
MTRINKFKEQFDNQGGFNLVELMITVAIIGVLAGMAVPNYTEAMYRVRVKTTISQLTQLAKTLHALRLVEDKVLFDLTSSHCIRCDFAAVGSSSDSWVLTAADLADYDALGMSGPIRDAWGQVFLIDENEQDTVKDASCNHDGITSVGRNRIYERGENHPPNGDDIRLWLPFYRKKDSTCVVKPFIQLGPNVYQ